MFRLPCLVLTALAAICAAKDLREVLLPDGKIVGGSDASISDFPHQVSVHYNGEHRCGGSIHTRNIVISSAFCIQGLDVAQITIVAGSSLLSERNIEIPVETIVNHPNYRPFNNDYDVAILVLDEPLEFNAGIHSIPLAKERFSEGTIVTVTGWGALAEDGAISDQLQKVDLKVVSNDKCKNFYSALFITDRMLCAAVTDGGKDACLGDSGSPLIVNKQLLGIVSWGTGCARANYPSVYASIPDLYKWIEETAKQNTICNCK